MGKIKDLRGMKFGRLTVVEFAEIRNRKAYWVCRCDCRRTTIVAGYTLQNGDTKSCGCRQRERAHETMTALRVAQGSDGRRKRRLYNTWYKMLGRCNKHYSIDYPRYGGRGIKVCPEWENDFLAFEAWALANGWREGLTLDRIDNNKGYCPENCRWITMKEQCSNTRRNIFVEYYGKQQSLAQWAFELGINYNTLLKRYKQGWSVERMLTEPVKTTKQKSEPGD